MENTQVITYKTHDGSDFVDVLMNEETVWLSLNQMSVLFGRDKSVISRHITNIFKERELDALSVVAKFATTAQDGKKYQVDYYNLDVIISVGYRVKSQRGTNFRIWATQILKKFLIERATKTAYSSEEKYLYLVQAIELATQTAETKDLSSQEAKGILKVLQEYAYALETLDKYDHQSLEIGSGTATQAVAFHYEEAIALIREWRIIQQAGSLFGNEKDDSFKSSLNAIFQTFDGQELYPSTEEKAANLLYFIVKNHSFSDGNKRIAAGLFIYFLSIKKK